MCLGRKFICSIMLCWFAVDSVVALFDPISLTLGAGALGLGAIGYDYIKQQTYCRVNECCNERSIPGNITELKENLKRDLLGQHIVIEKLIPALQAHFSPNTKSRKPLVISFHGTPGTGKNFVADHIADALYANGPKSMYVHKYLGRADFPLEEHANHYKDKINIAVRNAVLACPRSLFIFDEVDKMPKGIFESLTSLVDYHSEMNGHDYSKAIFIFLSNNAGVHISDRLGSLMKSGTLRDETKLSDFEQILEKAAYNLEGGLMKTSLIEAHVIDHYLPFLPLEKAHVIECIKVEFRRWGKEPKDAVVNKIIKDSILYDRTHGMFAISGCKTLEKKVAVEAMSMGN